VQQGEDTQWINREYYGHEMCPSLWEGPDLQSRARDEAKRTVRSLADLMARGENHIFNRSILQEKYEEFENDEAIYRQPIHFNVSFWKLTIDRLEEIGDKTSWLMRDVLEQNNAKKGDCVFQCMVDQFAQCPRSPLRDTIEQIRAKCGIPTGGVSFELLDHIERTYTWKGAHCRSKERSLGFCVFDARLNLRRLPPYRELDNNYKFYCNIVTFNGHAYAFKEETMARDRRRQTLSFYEAVITVATSARKEAKKKGHSDLYRQAYELFLETQHLLPDVGLVHQRINEKFGADVCSQVVVHNVTGTQKTWIPKSELPQKKVRPQFINKKGAYPDKTFDMDNVVSFDIETCSVAGTGGRFMTYAVGWQYGNHYKSFVAETEAELEQNTILWKAIQRWQEIAEGLQEPEQKRRKPLYIYAHNGSRFDAVAAIQTILANSPDVPTDQLESNGRFISFAYKDLVFRDSCLITMSSLKAAANSYGVQASKGYLPHGYLQNCSSARELLDRINRTMPWRELEPYMDWFTDAKDDDLHERKAGRTWEQWRDEQPLRKAFEPDKICDFRREMKEYLRQDVACLHQIVEVVGTSMARDYGADIRTKCTLGSLAEHVWQHSLKKNIPKLETEEQHIRWQHCNRGGFCGPLSKFDTAAPEGKQIYKVDVTSLYPSSACQIKYTTEAGEQEPLKAYYTGFPDPTNGWLQHDFGGAEMAKEHYDQLKDMHGMVRIRFDQRALQFPFFLKKMRQGSWGTLAPVLQGCEYYTTPHVRMAWDHGVKIQLMECEYTKETTEPYGEYMAHFAEMKNGADAAKEAAQKELKEKPERKVELDKVIQKAEFDRTLAKLFLNGLLGRNNMRIARSQTLITKSANDVIHCLGDGLAYQKAEVVPFQAGVEDVLRVKFQEGGYEDHIQQFNVVPYLSGYMLGYSKMLMQASFQHIAAIGAEAIYTDTDSIAFLATPEQWKQYADRFVPTKKTFGGMELEDTCSRLLSIGPKKYACVHEDGSYHWQANGMPARVNAHVDVLQRFERVLQGNVESVDYFSITAGSDFHLKHTTGASKKLRFICLKGKVEGEGKDTRIRWWDSEEEFAAHATSLRPIGWDVQNRS